MKQAMLVLSLAAAFATLILAPTKAQTGEATPEGLAVLRLIIKEVPKPRYTKDSVDWPYDPVWQASLADALHSYCESILVQVPRNTPQEDQWVDSEVQDSKVKVEDIKPGLNLEQLEKQLLLNEKQIQLNDKRLFRITRSVEFARKTLRNVLSRCTSLTKDLIERKSASPAGEALLWLRLSQLFSIEDMIWDFATTLELISPNYCKRWDPKTPIMEVRAPEGHDKNKICLWENVRLVIITNVVIPLLAAQQ